jgi:choline dehydrogenase-like flavoprotein
MGSSDDSEAVVDFEGRVHGVRNLRIADLSIAPNVVRAPANATAIMIGERMADLILLTEKNAAKSTTPTSVPA